MIKDPSLEVLLEIKDLLAIMAEPAIERQREKHFGIVRAVVGKGAKKRAAVLLMDGTKTRSEIMDSSGIDSGGLSRLASQLRDELVLVEQEGRPRLIHSLPSGFFDNNGEANDE